MRPQHEIQAELKDAGIHLPPASFREMTVPDGYFESFYDQLQHRIHLVDRLAELKHVNPYTTPPGYFQQVGQQLQTQIRQEDFLASLPTQMPYEVPGGYFDSVDKQILIAVNQSGKRPGVTPLRAFLQKISIAATLLLFLGLAFKGILFPSGRHMYTNTEAQLACISDAEISTYLLEHEAELSNGLALENVDASRLDLNTVESDVLDHVLDAVNDDELLNYPL